MAKWAHITDTGKELTFRVVETVTEDPAGRYANGIRWQPCPDEVAHEWIWEQDTDTWRAGNPNDVFLGLSQQEGKEYVRQVLDREYWRRVTLHEDCFNLGYPIYTGTSDASAEQIQAADEFRNNRRNYINNGDPPQNGQITRVLDSAEAYQQATKSARDAIWQDLKQQNMFYTEVPEDPRWPAVPAFEEAPNDDEIWRP